MVNVEARSLDAKVVTRRCVLAKLKELTIEKYRDIVSQSAGGILVLLPNNLAALPQEEQEVRSHCLQETVIDKMEKKTLQVLLLFTGSLQKSIIRSYAPGCEPLVTGNLAMGLTIRSSHKQELSSVYQFIDVLYSLCIYEALRH